LDLDSLDHVHLSVPDLDRAQEIYGLWLPGDFTPVYGSDALNAFGVWNMSGGDFIQVLDPAEPVFGASHIPSLGVMSVSFRVQDIDVGIEQAAAAGLRLRSRVGSEEIGMGKNVIQAQFYADETFSLGIELVEREIPGDPHVPMNESCIDAIEHTVADIAGPEALLTSLLGSPFDPPIVDPEAGAVSVRHPGFGLQLTAPLGAGGPVYERLQAQGPGLHAIAFQSRDLPGDVERAKACQLTVVRDREVSPGVREVEFAPESGVILRLVDRAANGSAATRLQGNGGAQ